MNEKTRELPWKQLASARPGLRATLDLGESARILAGQIVRVAAERFQVRVAPAPWPTNIAPEHRWPAIALGFLSWGLDCFESVVLLTSAGLLVHAKVLSRSLLEGLVNLLYISEKPDERAQRFLSYYWAEQKRFLNKTAEIARKDELPVDRSYRDAVNANYQQHCREHRDKKGNPKISWHGKQTADLFREISKTTPGFEGWYEIIYSPASNVAHVSTSAFVQYLRPSPKTGALRLGAQPSVSDVRGVLKLATFDVVETAGVANRALSLGFDERLCALAKALDALHQKRPGTQP